MDNEHGKGTSVKDSRFQTDIEDDQLDKSISQKHETGWFSLRVGLNYPLQLINAPIAADSRRLKPNSLAAAEQGTNLAKKDTVQSNNVQPQVTPSFSSPRLVRNPESVKYYNMPVRRCFVLLMKPTYQWQEDD